MRIQTGLIILTLLLTGCPAQPTKDGEDTAKDGAASTGNQDAGAQTSQLGDRAEGKTTTLVGGDEPYRKDAINDATSPLSQQIIYFEFNASTIKQEYNELLVWHGRYLASNPDMKVRLEGHTDERGSREYNIALAERRAQAVGRVLQFQGAKNDQIQTLSYGEEKPVAHEHNEEAWRQNRRVQLIYEAK